ncbi:MAG: peptidoglycan DD-metalloendopeptidase family protein [bacterium]|nr:peptidoglycan DD-metalloendopeptidase family protein [bacterium]
MKRIYNVIITSNTGDFYKSFSITYKKWKIIRFLLILFSALIIVSAFFYGRLYLLALKARALEVENQKLREENQKVKELEKQLYALEELRVKIYKMLGVDKTPTMETLYTALSTKEGPTADTIDKNDKLKSISKEFKEYAKILYDEERFIPRGLPAEGFITQKFSSTHEGIDIAAPIGTPVKSPADGVVKDIYEDQHLGIVLLLGHGSKYETLYGHLKEVFVKKGQVVKKGDVIALTGNSGISTGPHLHYEVRYLGIKMNPENYLY